MLLLVKRKTLDLYSLQFLLYLILWLKNNLLFLDLH